VSSARGAAPAAARERAPPTRLGHPAGRSCSPRCCSASTSARRRRAGRWSR
jgi:hypothetical protein